MAHRRRGGGEERKKNSACLKTKNALVNGGESSCVWSVNIWYVRTPVSDGLPETRRHASTPKSIPTTRLCIRNRLVAVVRVHRCGVGAHWLERRLSPWRSDCRVLRMACCLPLLPVEEAVFGTLGSRDTVLSRGSNTVTCPYCRISSAPTATASMARVCHGTQRRRS